ncbi:GNAT family N-acetyltransferase [Falsibacillus albus]|uniref:GNAT family N-acetyltransferase n=1 Tax=Falsibacillus albus TaxID=2478915 RepID=A0A3L7JYJ7_9BACI|nr:GNAT family N-acetyltransferase [Falsibacillus albus]RLQ95365.1 GNAT family N-acetyltransferase [Falsibacillus albus]
MQWRRYDSAAEFLVETERLLEENEAENNLMLGLLYQLKKSNRKGIYMAAATDKGEVKLICLMTPPYNLIMTVPKGSDYEEVVDFAIGELVYESVNVPGVIAEKNLAEYFSRTWAEKTGQESTFAMKQRIYKLNKVNDLKHTPGKMRKARSNEKELVASWLLRFISDTGEPALTKADAELRVAVMIEQGTVFLWENDGEPVSMARSARSTKNVAVVNMVYTPDEQRKKGYATAMVSNLSRLLLQNYEYCALYTDLANPSSNKIYMQIGYEPILDSSLIKFV